MKVQPIVISDRDDYPKYENYVHFPSIALGAFPIVALLVSFVVAIYIFS